MGTVVHDEPNASSVALSCRHLDYFKSPTEQEARGLISIIFTVNTVLSLPLWGWVISLYFGWFVVPIFNLPQINFVQGTGLGLLVGFLRYKLGSRHVSREETVYRMIEDWTEPPWAIVCGFILAHFFLGTA